MISIKELQDLINDVRHYQDGLLRAENALEDAEADLESAIDDLKEQSSEFLKTTGWTESFTGRWFHPELGTHPIVDAVVLEIKKQSGAE